MDKTNLLKILEGNISLIDKVDVTDVALYKDRITVEPHHVRKMIYNFLERKIGANDLTSWAKFICLRAEYGIPYYLDDEKADYYEDMFYVIQRLSTPEIDGQITEERVKTYLTELSKYDD